MANKEIPELTSAATPTGDELTHIIQGDGASPETLSSRQIALKTMLDALVGRTARKTANLVVQNNATTPNTKIDVTADFAVMRDSAGRIFTDSSVSLTIDCSTTGANGLDSGSLGVSIWYYIYLISNGSATAGLVSASSSSPTLPSGYAYSALIAAIPTDGSSNLQAILRRGNTTVYTNSPITIDSGVQGDWSVPTWHAASVSTAVPTAFTTHIEVRLTCPGAAAAAAHPSSTVGNWTNYGSCPLLGVRSQTANEVYSMSGWWVLESTNIYYASNTANAYLRCHGWKDSL